MTVLNQLAHEVYLESKCQHANRSGLSIHFSDRSHAACPISMNETDFKFVLMNLLTSAIKSSHESGDVFIELRRQGWKCAVDVIDYGSGFSEDLTRASHLVQKASGAMTFESMQGHGKRVRVELPLAT